MPAQSEKNIIRSKFSPTLKLDELSIVDFYTGTLNNKGDNKPAVAGEQVQQQLGIQYPFIAINDYTFNINEIKFFTLDCTGFLPKIKFTVQFQNTDIFKVQSTPKDGDIVNLFIRAKNDTFKPIRNDYIITNMDMGPGGVYNKGSYVTFEGELFIPHARDQISKSYKGTSYNVLQRICSELGLGFASNQDANSSTIDEQVWVCPGDNYYEFMQNIVDHAWKDGTTFYTAFIDVYYHLNFIDVNAQISMTGEEKIESSILDVIVQKGLSPDTVQNVTDSQTVTGKVLTNIEGFEGTNQYILNYAMKNESSDVARRYGYKNFIRFYDMLSRQKWDITVDPIITPGSSRDKIILRGRPYPKLSGGNTGPYETYYETQSNYIWAGVQSKNVHANYIYAKYHNLRNLQELRKMYVEVNIPKWNPNVYLGEKLPLIIYNGPEDNQKRNLQYAGKQQEDAKSTALEVSLDHFYSGHYMVYGFNITYAQMSSSINTVSNQEKAEENRLPPNKTEPGFVQSLILTRREWPTPVTSK